MANLEDLKKLVQEQLLSSMTPKPRQSNFIQDVLLPALAVPSKENAGFEESFMRGASGVAGMNLSQGQAEQNRIVELQNIVGKEAFKNMFQADEEWLTPSEEERNLFKTMTGYELPAKMNKGMSQLFTSGMTTAREGKRMERIKEQEVQQQVKSESDAYKSAVEIVAKASGGFDPKDTTQLEQVDKLIDIIYPQYSKKKKKSSEVEQPKTQTKQNFVNIFKKAFLSKKTPTDSKKQILPGIYE